VRSLVCGDVVRTVAMMGSDSSTAIDCAGGRALRYPQRTWGGIQHHRACVHGDGMGASWAVQPRISIEANFRAIRIFVVSTPEGMGVLQGVSALACGTLEADKKRLESSVRVSHRSTTSISLESAQCRRGKIPDVVP